MNTKKTYTAPSLAVEKLDWNFSMAEQSLTPPKNPNLVRPQDERPQDLYREGEY